MNKTIKNIVSLNKELEKEIPLVLEDTILALKKLVEDESILSFSFQKNDIYLAQEKPVYVTIATQELDGIKLGMLESMSAVEKARKFKIPKELKKTLDNLNANLFVLNEHFPKKMPSIKTATHFSIMSVNKEGGFAKEEYKVLPEFIFDTPVAKKVKKHKIK